MVVQGPTAHHGTRLVQQRGRIFSDKPPGGNGRSLVLVGHQFEPRLVALVDKDGFVFANKHSIDFDGQLHRPTHTPTQCARAPPESRQARVPSLPRSPRVSRESLLRRDHLAVRAVPREQILHQMLRDLWGGEPVGHVLGQSPTPVARGVSSPPDPWTWPSCAAFAANRWYCAYPARKRTRIASTSNSLKGPAASFSGETNHPAVKSNAGSSKASTPIGAPSDAVLPLPCTLSVPGARLPTRAIGNPRAPPKSTSDGPWLAKVDCTKSTNRERAVGARTRRSKTWTPLRFSHFCPRHARQRVSRHRLGRLIRARRVSTPRTRVSQLARGCGTPDFFSTRGVPGFVRQGSTDRGGRPSQDSRTELPTLRGRTPDLPSQPPRPLAPTLPGICHRASHRGGLQLLSDSGLPGLNLESLGCLKYDVLRGQDLPRDKREDLLPSCGFHTDPTLHHCPVTKCHAFSLWYQHAMSHV